MASRCRPLPTERAAEDRDVEVALVVRADQQRSRQVGEPLRSLDPRPADQQPEERTDDAVDDLAPGAGQRARAARRSRHGPPASAIRSAQYVSGSARSSESTRSRMPPNPGSQVPASLTPNSRLAADLRRSPQTDPSPTMTTRPRNSGRLPIDDRAGARTAMPDGGPQQASDQALRASSPARATGRSGTVPKRLPDDERPDVGARRSRDRPRPRAGFPPRPARRRAPRRARA